MRLLVFKQIARSNVIRGINGSITVILIFCGTTFSQPDKIMPLKIGDKVPDYTLKRILNYHSKTAKLTDFNGKLLILDFWATWCTWCVASMPKLHEIQNEFKDDVQIILVNKGESENVGQRFLNKRENVAGLKTSLPVVYEDSVLSDQLFQFSSLPFVVWIGGDGIVKYFTLGNQVTKGNVKAALTGKPVDISSSAKLESRKNAFYFFNFSPPDSLLWQSTLLSELPGFAFGARIKTLRTGLSFIAAANNSAVDLYRFAYGDLNTSSQIEDTYMKSVGARHVILNVSDSLRKMLLTRFSYRLLAPKYTSPQKLQLAMQSDLKRYFSLAAKREVVDTKCLVLTAFDSTLIPKYEDGKFRSKTSDTELILNKTTFLHFLDNAEYVVPFGIDFLPPYVIVDETGVRRDVGLIEVETDVRDYERLNHALQKFGLSLSLEQRRIEMLVIEEQKNVN